jgi:hypothetical protein
MRCLTAFAVMMLASCVSAHAVERGWADRNPPQWGGFQKSESGDVFAIDLANMTNEIWWPGSSKEMHVALAWLCEVHQTGRGVECKYDKRFYTFDCTKHGISVFGDFDKGEPAIITRRENISPDSVMGRFEEIVCRSTEPHIRPRGAPGFVCHRSDGYTCD